jgi:phage terminase small subunit
VTNLSDKQQKFCEEYLIDFNATQAAIRAGYSKKTADVQASRLLVNVKVAKYLNSKQEKALQKYDASLDRTLQEITRLAFQDARHYFDENGRLIPIDQLSDDAAASLAGFEVEEVYEFEDGDKKPSGQLKKIKRYDKNKALEMLMRYHGAFKKDNEQQRDYSLTIIRTGVNAA